VGGSALLALGVARAVLPPEAFRTARYPVGGLAVAGRACRHTFVATFTARLPLGAPLRTRLPTSPRFADAIALTFDDGPHPETTPRLLDLLRGAPGGPARATFFVIGERAARYSDLIRRIADEGHVIGVHGLRHRTMVLQSAQQIVDDLREAARRIKQAAGDRATGARLLRPPYGFKTATLCRTAARQGYALVAWSLDPRDYDPIMPTQIRARIAARLRPRDIVLLHERPGVTRTLDALPGVLHDIARRGWRCVPLENAP
jgi:peptidoglycan/xylan/chitin deacetylase (PgdA/CDA1 family)